MLTVLCLVLCLVTMKVVEKEIFLFIFKSNFIFLSFYKNTCGDVGANICIRPWAVLRRTMVQE